MGTPCSEFGLMLPQSQGRAANSNNRVTMQHIGHLIKNSNVWKTEKSLILQISDSTDLSDRKALNHLCGIVYLDIDENLNVFYGGGCDGDPFHFAKDQVLLGNLKSESIHSCYEKYLNNPPKPVRLLSEITWGELAKKYGDPDNERVYHNHISIDAVNMRWYESSDRIIVGLNI